MIKRCLCYTFLHLLILTSSVKNVSAQNLKFGFDIKDNKPKTSIPFELKSNLIIVNIVFEDVIPLKFIVDTGVSNSVLIEKDYSDLLKIEPDRKITLVGAAGTKEVEAYIVNSVKIEAGSISGNNIPLLILKEDYLKLQEKLGIKIHGILGYDFLKNFIVKIDYKNNILRFYQPSAFKRPLLFYEALDLKVEQSKAYLYENMQLNDSTSILSKLMIDTGASHSLMLHQYSSKYITIPDKNVRDVLGAGIAGTIEGHAARIPNLSLGKYLFEDIVTSYPDSGAYEAIIEGTGRNGTIGGGLLSKLHIFLDYSNEKIYIKRNSIFKERFKHDMSGMSLVAKGEFYLEPYYQVQRVRKGTPAYHAGLRAEDKIISFNGISGRNLSLEYMVDQLSKKEGKRIKIKIKRGQEIRTFTFYLKAFI